MCGLRRDGLEAAKVGARRERRHVNEPDRVVRLESRERHIRETSGFAEDGKALD